ncbi:hypothetical protein FRC07_000043 [Ceratobasidium sp. 392]|nr:hypothetical protein FRC07_000043 [Ceratobasidium sp. 392]
MLLKIGIPIIEWANINHIESLMRQGQIAADLKAFNHIIDAYATKFQIVSANELKRQWHKADKCYRKDRKEAKKRLLTFLRNDKDIEAAVGMRRDGVLHDQKSEAEEQETLREGLSTLYGKTKILPPLTDRKFPHLPNDP